MNPEESGSRNQAVVTDTLQPLTNSSKLNKYRWKSLPLIGVGFLGIFTCICAMGIYSPHFKGAIGFKITPHGLEFQLDRR